MTSVSTTRSCRAWAGYQQGAIPLEKEPSPIASLFPQAEPSSDRQKIRGAQVESWQKAFICSLQKYREILRSSTLPEVSLSCSYKYVLQMAELLVQADGTLDVSRIPDLQKLQDDPCWQEAREASPSGLATHVPAFIKRAKHILKLLQMPNSPLIRIFNEVKLPENPDSMQRCNLIIRSTLDKVDICDRDAKVVFLATLLALEYQTNTNTCEADWLYKACSHINPVYLAPGLAQVLMDGAYLVNYLDQNIALNFPPSISSQQTTASIQVDCHGLIQNGDGSLAIFALPQLQSALLQMGIPSDNEALNAEVLAKLFADGQSSISTSVEKIIIAYAELQAAPIDCERARMKEIARLTGMGTYASSAKANMPLAKAMISCFLDAGQYAPGHMPVSWVIESVQKAFDAGLSELDSASQPASQQSLVGWAFSYVPFFSSWFPNEEGENALAVVKNAFYQTLGKVTSVHYEQHKKMKHDVYGLNTLYKRKIEQPLNSVALGDRVDSAEAFQQFVQESVRIAAEAVQKSELLTAKTKAACAAIFGKMENFAAQEAFVTGAVNAFNAYFAYHSDPSQPYDTSQMTPWSFYANNMGRTNTSLILGTPMDEQNYTQCHTAHIQDFLEWLFGNVIDIANLSLDPFNNPTCFNGTVFSPKYFIHSFNWLTSSKTLRVLKEYMHKTNVGWKQALDDMVKAPGMEVAETPVLNANTYLAEFVKACEAICGGELQESISLESLCKEDVGEKLPLNVYSQKLQQALAARIASNGELTKILQSRANDLLADNPTIYSVSQLVIGVLNQLYNSENDKAVSVAIQGFVSLMAIKMLSPQNYQKIAQNAIAVANTNWVDTGGFFPAEWLFCIYYDPATESYALGQIQESNQGLFPIPLLPHLGAFKQNLKEVIFPSLEF